MQQSLADYLGTKQPADGAPAPVPIAPEKMTGAEFASAVLSSLEFRQYVVNGLILGTIPQSVVLRLMDYAEAEGWGKPVDKLEIDDKREQIGKLSKQELIARIQKLQAIVQELPDDSSDTVH